MHYRDDNPRSQIEPVLGPQQALVQHMQALPHRDVAAVVETVRASGTAHVVKLVFESLVLTAARAGEVCGTEYAEIDSAEPRVDRTGDRGPRRSASSGVPLSRRAEQVLNAASLPHLSEGSA